MAASDAAAESDDPTVVAIIDAALRQFELFGVSRSTMDDIARRAKLARVTLYRRFPGKSALVAAVLQRELRRFLVELDATLDAVEDPDERLVEGFAFAFTVIRGHTLLQRVLETEPETIVPSLTTEGTPFLALARTVLAERLARDFVRDRAPEDVAIVADLTARLVVSMILTPQTLVDLDDPDQVRDLARRYMRPLLVGSGPRD